MNDNVFETLEKSFIDVPIKDQLTKFSFTGNEIYNTVEGSFGFLPNLTNHLAVEFDDNYFHQLCYCNISVWLRNLMSSEDTSIILNTSFCKVNDILSTCFELPEGLINMKNFTELVCGEGDKIVCEPYIGATKILESTPAMPFDHIDKEDNSNLIVGLGLGILLIIAVSGTIVILLIRGGIWLKKKGYCVHFRNMRLAQNEPNNEDEGAMVDLEQTINRSDPRPTEELTLEFLTKLRADLNNPETHDEARELIEKLYEQFIVTDSYTNNNKTTVQDEETHLYEELSNHQNNRQQGRAESYGCLMESPITLIKYMEEKVNTKKGDSRPALVGEYSEPSDAAVHLYSELRQNKIDVDDAENKSSLKSNASSGRMAFRPLPDKPKDNNVPGPSSKY